MTSFFRPLLSWDAPSPASSRRQRHKEVEQSLIRNLFGPNFVDVAAKRWLLASEVCAMTSALDDAVGEVMGTLKEQGLYEDSSDAGGSQGLGKEDRLRNSWGRALLHGSEDSSIISRDIFEICETIVAIFGVWHPYIGDS